MAEYTNRENPEKKAKIKTHFARIIVNSSGKPYYTILYFDPEDEILHIGFGSYELAYVRKWLEEEFEVDETLAADVVPVRHGRMVGGKGEFCSTCSECGEILIKRWSFCPNCGAKMDGEPN